MRKSGDRGEPARLKDLLGEVGTRLGMRRATAVGELWVRWAEIVGGDIAANAEPTSVRDGVLRIRTASPTWATEIGYLGDEIAGRVNTAMGGDLVREVRVWTAPGPIRSRGIEHAPEKPGMASGAPKERARADRVRSPMEALEAARGAWKRRLAAGRSARPKTSEEGTREGP